MDKRYLMCAIRSYFIDVTYSKDQVELKDSKFFPVKATKDAITLAEYAISYFGISEIYAKQGRFKKEGVIDYTTHDYYRFTSLEDICRSKPNARYTREEMLKFYGYNKNHLALAIFAKLVVKIGHNQYKINNELVNNILKKGGI